MEKFMRKMGSTLEYRSKICPECGEEVYKNIRGYFVRVMCSCEKKRSGEKKKEMEKKERLIKLNSIRQASMMDKQFREDRFENFIVSDSNKKTLSLARNYVDNWEDMKKENIGLLFYGAPGVGKSFLSNCIANALLDRLVPVVVISSIGIINKVFDSYDSYDDRGEYGIIKEFNKADLLIIDDLGAEYTKDKGKQIIYSIIDERTRSKKPTIITSNLTPQDLKDKLTGSDGIERTADRLFLNCYPIEIKAESKRRKMIPRKEKIIREVLLGN